jgi:hypothetical protein
VLPLLVETREKPNFEPRYRMSETLAQAAARLTQELGGPVTPRQVQLWRGKQYPVDDASALRVRLSNQERVPKWLREASTPQAKPSIQPLPPGDDLSPEALDARLRVLQASLLATTDYESARTIRTQIAALRDVFRIQKERGIYVLMAEVHAAARHAGNASKQKWEKLEDDLPPLLEGKEAAQMKTIIRKLARARCEDMAGLFLP